MNDLIKINWYRTKVDKKVMSKLMEKSDSQGFRQVILQLGLFCVTALAAYLAFQNIHSSNWPLTVPIFGVALFLNGTVAFFANIAMHELAHKTPFRTPALNDFFLKLFSFLVLGNPVFFRASHVKHHQYTVHHDLDGEVVLPQKLDWYSVNFALSMIFGNPYATVFTTIPTLFRYAHDDIRDPWMKQILGEPGSQLRLEHQRWARLLVYSHLALATLFVAIGHWELILIFTFSGHYSPWLGILCASTQHIGMTPDAPDFRVSCRTFTCSWLPAFLYWNMQYHVEHHMFPAVPFYHLPKLRKAIEHDLPPCTHGLWATWMEIIDILKKQKADPTYFYTPKLPQSQGERVGDNELENEASDKSLVPAAA